MRGFPTIVKTEGCMVIHQEVDKAVNDDVTWSCGEVIEVVLYDNMFALKGCKRELHTGTNNNMWY